MKTDRNHDAKDPAPASQEPPLWFKIVCITLAVFVFWIVCFGWVRLFVK
jgi:uncharacterized membrane protein YhdT